GLRQDEVRALALAGALTSFGGDRRAALWQAERAGRPAGPLIDDDALAGSEDTAPAASSDRAGASSGAGSPLAAMTLAERVQADYDVSGLSIGPHPMALVRASLAPRGVARASDLARERAGRRVR